MVFKGTSFGTHTYSKTHILAIMHTYSKTHILAIMHTYSKAHLLALMHKYSKAHLLAGTHIQRHISHSLCHGRLLSKPSKAVLGGGSGTYLLGGQRYIAWEDFWGSLLISYRHIIAYGGMPLHAILKK